MTWTPFGLTALLAISLVAPNPGDEPKSTPYFPTQVGARWVYKSGKRDVVEIVEAVQVKDGATIVSVGWESGGKVTPGYKVVVSDKGVYRVATEPGGEPYCLLKLPHKPGEKWEKELVVGGTKVPVVVTAEEPESVKVPAGIFRALRFREEYTIQGVTSRTTFWYAPGVGMVKMEADTIDKVLTSFTPGKD